MAEFVIMPKLGFDMGAGQLVKWHKREGDTIQKGDLLVEILTDKTNMEVESTLSGVVRKILADEGVDIPVTLPIAIIGDELENIDDMVKEAQAKLGRGPQVEVMAVADQVLQAEPKAEENAPLVLPSDIKLKLSPRARNFIKKNNIDLASLNIKGSGFQGGITEKDIEEYVKLNVGKVTPLAQRVADAANIELACLRGLGIGGKITKADVAAAMSTPEEKTAPQQDVYGGRKVLTTINYSGMRKVIGDRLSQSKFSAPHVYFTTSVDVSNLVELRKQVNQSQTQKVSVNDFIVGAVTRALLKYPELNSSLLDDKIVQFEDINIGVAVGLENGLIVPVIKNTQNKRISQIAAEAQFLVEKARNGKLLPDDYQGGTFTVSNLGMFDIENFTAIINPPEAGILSISAVKKVPVVVEDDGEDKVLIKPIMKITLSVDHRIVDGLLATRVVNEIKALLENPFSIII